MGMFFGTKPGEAYIESVKDPRWDYSVKCEVGGFTIPAELEKKIEQLEKKYGPKPDDLKWGYHKD